MQAGQRWQCGPSTLQRLLGACRWITIVIMLIGLLPRAASQLLKVCLVQNPGFANCTMGGNQTYFNGIDVDLIRLIAQQYNWVEVYDNTTIANLSTPAFIFECTDLRVIPVINILTDPNSTDMSDCAMGAGAVTATSARVQQGARFSWPHMHSSLGVMVASGTQSTFYNKWAFLEPFSSGIWITVIGSTILTPVLLSVFENLIQTGRIPLGSNLLTEWRHASYTMFLCCFNLTVLEVLSWPCQLIIICFAFTNLILVASYTANLAAVLTASVSSTGITQVSDLINKNVAAHGPYVSGLLTGDLIRATTLNWGGESTFLQVMDMLLNGELDAYIFDRPLLQFYMNLDDPDCQLRLLSDTEVEPYDYGIAFHRLMPDDIIRNFSLGVLTAQSEGQLTNLQQEYLPSNPSCSSSVGGYSNALQFAQISGLYIILGTAVGLGLLASMYSVWRQHVHEPRRRKRALLAKQAELEQMQTKMAQEYSQTMVSPYEVYDPDDHHYGASHRVVTKIGSMGPLPVEVEGQEGESESAFRTDADLLDPNNNNNEDSRDGGGGDSGWYGRGVPLTQPPPPPLSPSAASASADPRHHLSDGASSHERDVVGGVFGGSLNAEQQRRGARGDSASSSARRGTFAAAVSKAMLTGGGSASSGLPPVSTNPVPPSISRASSGHHQPSGEQLSVPPTRQASMLDKYIMSTNNSMRVGANDGSQAYLGNNPPPPTAEPPSLAPSVDSTGAHLHSAAAALMKCASAPSAGMRGFYASTSTAAATPRGSEVPLTPVPSQREAMPVSMQMPSQPPQPPQPPPGGGGPRAAMGNVAPPNDGAADADAAATGGGNARTLSSPPGLNKSLNKSLKSGSSAMAFASVTRMAMAAKKLAGKVFVVEKEDHDEDDSMQATLKPSQSLAMAAAAAAASASQRSSLVAVSGVSSTFIQKRALYHSKSGNSHAYTPPAGAQMMLPPPGYPAAVSSLPADAAAVIGMQPQQMVVAAPGMHPFSGAMQPSQVIQMLAPGPAGGQVVAGSPPPPSGAVLVVGPDGQLCYQTTHLQLARPIDDTPVFQKGNFASAANSIMLAHRWSQAANVGSPPMARQGSAAAAAAAASTSSSGLTPTMSTPAIEISRAQRSSRTHVSGDLGSTSPGHVQQTQVVKQSSSVLASPPISRSSTLSRQHSSSATGTRTREVTPVSHLDHGTMMGGPGLPPDARLVSSNNTTGAQGTHTLDEARAGPSS